MLPTELPPLPVALRTRIAPTPSGLLHAGNATAFLLTRHLANVAGGSVLLRIDDLDAERARPEYVRNIFNTLDRLAIAWDNGPKDEEELRSKWSQRLRMPEHLRLVEELCKRGHLYACSCSRSDVLARTGSARYDGHCRNLSIPFTKAGAIWRLAVPDGSIVTWKEWPSSQRSLDPALEMGDPVVRQRDGRPAYQIASLCDDVTFGMNFIVRGEDLLPSSACQLYMADLLGLEQFRTSTFLHHPLLLDAQGAKLSKSTGAMPVAGSGAAGEKLRTEQAAAEMLRSVLGS